MSGLWIGIHSVPILGNSLAVCSPEGEAVLTSQGDALFVTHKFGESRCEGRSEFVRLSYETEGQFIIPKE